MTLSQNIDPKAARAGLPVFAEMALVVFALPMLLPLMALIALAIRVTSPGPVILTRTLEGQNGRRYREYRFRCVHMDATKRQWQAQLQGHTSDRDPRLTAVGHFLLVSGLNHLPRLFNVLKGDIRLNAGR